MWPFKAETNVVEKEHEETFEEKRDRLYPNYEKVVAEEQRKAEEEQRVRESWREAILDKYDLRLKGPRGSVWTLLTKDECFFLDFLGPDAFADLIRPGSDAEKQLDESCRKFRDTVDRYK